MDFFPDIQDWLQQHTTDPQGPRLKLIHKVITRCPRDQQVFTLRVAARTQPPGPPTDDSLIARFSAVVPPKSDAAPSASCMPGMISLLNDSGITLSDAGSDCLEFILKNSGSPRINPHGDQGYSREYQWTSAADSRQEEFLHIHEQSYGDTDSASSMETEITFIPRIVLPAIRKDEARNRYVVTIPTGETVEYDLTTKEIVDGVLTETAPIDLSPNRQTRKFAGLKYTGKGITIRSDQRGDSTRSSLGFGTIKRTATIQFAGRTCTVLPSELWNQSSDDLPFLFPTDAAFYSFLQRRCKWNVNPAYFADLEAAALETVTPHSPFSSFSASLIASSTSGSTSSVSVSGYSVLPKSSISSRAERKVSSLARSS